MSNTRIGISILTVIGIVIYAPLISLWSLKTIFSFNIQYNFWSWAAMSWIHFILFLIRSNPTTIVAQQLPQKEQPSSEVL